MTHTTAARRETEPSATQAVRLWLRRLLHPKGGSCVPMREYRTVTSQVAGREPHSHTYTQTNKQTNIHTEHFTLESTIDSAFKRACLNAATLPTRSLFLPRILLLSLRRQILRYQASLNTSHDGKMYVVRCHILLPSRSKHRSADVRAAN